MIEPLQSMSTNVYIPADSYVEIQKVVDTFMRPCLRLIQSISSFLPRFQDAKTSEELKDDLQNFHNTAERLSHVYYSSEVQRAVNVLRDGLDVGTDRLRFDLNVSNAQPREKQEIMKQLEENIASLRSFPGRSELTTQRLEHEDPF